MARDVVVIDIAVTNTDAVDVAVILTLLVLRPMLVPLRIII